MAKVEKVAPSSSSLGKVQFPVRQSTVIAAELLGGGDRRPMYTAACKDPDRGGGVNVTTMFSSKFCNLGISATAPVMFCKQGSDWMICCEKGSTARAAIVMTAPRFASQLGLVSSARGVNRVKRPGYMAHIASSLGTRLTSSKKDPHAPLLAWSSRSISASSRGWSNHNHLNWLIPYYVVSYHVHSYNKPFTLI